MILTKKETSAREQTRARVLDLLARPKHPELIASLLKVGVATVYNSQKRFWKRALRRLLMTNRFGQTAAHQAGRKS